MEGTGSDVVLDLKTDGGMMSDSEGKPRPATKGAHEGAVRQARPPAQHRLAALKGGCGHDWPPSNSEDDFAYELHVEGLAGAEAGGAVEVADGVADVTVRTDRARSARQVFPVEQVEHLGAKL